ncbi:MAG: TetR/AcrR family transcriptional regulator [Chitinophagaceae bacterium]|nr:MAG: TetR/AcrR family transcriptional regulator [Chitinophagaceae bacterium]
MKNTKERIIDASVLLFNQKGISAVSLRDIADYIGISSGNLSYHYKNKNYIIDAIFEKMEKERNELLNAVEQHPSFENINLQALAIVRLSIRYRFFYLDTLDIIRENSKLGKLHRQYIERHIQYVNMLLNHAAYTGHLIETTNKNLYKKLSEMVWFTLQFWIQAGSIRGKKTIKPEEAVETMWQLILPYLTSKGKEKIPLNLKTIKLIQ